MLGIESVVKRKIYRFSIEKIDNTQSLRICACDTLEPGGTLWVSHTLPPMVDPAPMVIRPSTVAPA